MNALKSKNESQRPICRRRFLKLAGVTTVAAAVAAPLWACAPAPEEPVAAAEVVLPSPTSAPTDTSQAMIRRPEAIKFYPDRPSTVVQARHSGVWKGEELAPEAVRQMLDASIVRLTGLESPVKAWSAIFSPDDKIAIKVNTIRNSLFWTHAPLVMAVVDSLEQAGVPAEQIVIYDREVDELTGAGFAINESGPGVRCRATGSDYAEGWKVVGSEVGISNVLLDCTALINMPILKSHVLCGVTFAMKNHYGTFDQPANYHSRIYMMPAIAELNALPPIKDRQRLIIGDALLSTLKEAVSWPYWRDPVVGDSIFMSYDPVACDTVGLQYWCQLKEKAGEDTKAPVALAKQWLQGGADLGVGTNDMSKIDLAELSLS